MEKSQLSAQAKLVLGLIVFFIVSLISCVPGTYTEQLSIISGSENETLEPLIHEFEQKHRIKIDMHYKGSVDIMLQLQQNDFPYDAIWPANGLWIHIGDTKRRVKHIQSIMTSPVVFGIRQSLAKDLGFIGKKVYVNDILEVIQSGKLKFMMTSATQSNSGASAYFGFLYALLGNPDYISREDLYKDELKTSIRALFSGVHRSSASSGWLKSLFLESDYDAMVNYEALIIETNIELIRQGKEPLQIIYPVDGIVIADSPLGYVHQGSNRKEEAFLEFQEFLLSSKTQNQLSKLGRRTGMGGLNESTLDPEVFNQDWGIDTQKILSPFPIPSAEVIHEALSLYQTVYKKPSFTVFALDYSGSMQESGEREMKEAMRLLLDPSTSSKYYIQTGSEDISIVIPFNAGIIDIWSISGNKQGDLNALYNQIDTLTPDGGTDIYSPVIQGLEIMKEFQNLSDYVPAIILMTDGESNRGKKFPDLQTAYQQIGLDVPVFSIIFGNAVERQLLEIADLTKSRVFDGKKDLISTFRNAKGYN